MSLKKYIAEAEERMHRPDVGDTFAIELEDGTLLETYIMAMEHNAILLDATDRIVSVLAEWNYIGDEAGDVLLEGAYESEDEESAFDRQEHDHEEIEATDAVAQQDSGEYDYEGDMAKDDLYTIIRAARKLTGMLDDNENMPEWVQSKINKAADYVDTAADYIESNKQRAQGVAEGSEESVSFREMVDVVDQHYPKYYAELSGSDISDKQFERAIVNAYKEIIKKQGVAEGETPESELERLKLRQNAEHGRAPLRRQAATQARIRELEKQIKDKQGMAEGSEQLHPETLELIDEYILKIEPDANRNEMIQSVIDGTIHTSELEYALQGMDEAKYQGREVPLGKPMRGDVAKFKVYVRDPSTGNIKKVNFGHGGTSAKRAGQKTMRIKKSNPARRRSFRARHNCDNPGSRLKARYWSCRAW